MATAARTPKEERLDVRLTEDAKDLLCRAAAAVGQSLSDFVRGASLEAADDVLSRVEPTVLSGEAGDRLLRLLADPPPPNAKLRAAAEHYRSAVG